MKCYYKFLLIIFLGLFTIIYSNKIKELSDKNNTLLVAINDYASRYSLNNNVNCIEGSINEYGITLGYSGKSVSIEDSYSNMKGMKFNENLIEYKKNKCILNKEDNIDKYIISGNKYEHKISLVIDIDSMNYYKYFKKVSEYEKIDINYLVNINTIKYFDKEDNILIKTNSNNIKEFKDIINHFYCVKYNNYDVLEYCKKEKINSINIVNYIKTNLVINTKKILDNGVILFIEENSNNYKEFHTLIKYIKSKGYDIVSIDDLLG